MFFLNGFEPVFNLDVKYAFQLRNLPYYALLGLICGLMSYYFTQINGRIAAGSPASGACTANGSSADC